MQRLDCAHVACLPAQAYVIVSIVPWVRSCSARYAELTSCLDKSNICEGEDRGWWSSHNPDRRSAIWRSVRGAQLGAEDEGATDHAVVSEKCGPLRLTQV